jgi:hypothetical protein
VRRELVGLEDALHRPQADTRRLGQHPARPVGGLSRRRAGHEIDDQLHSVGRQRRLTGLARLIAQQPVDPSAMNRACQVHTTGFALPDRRMISAVPQPSAVARMIWARHTCFCGAQRSETIASSRRRSARVTLTTIPGPGHCGITGVTIKMGPVRRQALVLECLADGGQRAKPRTHCEFQSQSHRPQAA